MVYQGSREIVEKGKVDWVTVRSFTFFCDTRLAQYLCCQL